MAEKQPISDSEEFENILRMASPSKSGMASAIALKHQRRPRKLTYGILTCDSSHVFGSDWNYAVGFDRYVRFHGTHTNSKSA